MVDFHSHILPGIDDGSKNVKESLDILKEMYSQGITKVVATPHFLARHQSVEEFVFERNKAIETLKESLDGVSDIPQVYVGSETEYYDGIGECEGIEKLCIMGTRLILVEMPFNLWTEAVYRNLMRIQERGFVPVIAHLERYISYQNEEKCFERLEEMGVQVQCNCTFFTRRMTRKKAIRYIGGRRINFIGTDSHDMNYRKPKMKKALKIIEKKYGYEAVEDLLDYSESALRSATVVI